MELKMKTFFKIVTLAVAIVSSSAVSAAQKIAVVFPSKIMQQSPLIEKINKELEAEFKSRVDELKTLQQEGQKLQSTLQRDGQLMSASEVANLQREIEIKSFELKLKNEGLSNDSRRRRNDEQQKALLTVQKVIQAVAAKNGYDMVVNAEQLLFAKPELDISDIVIKEISKK
jgi:outer membrane protein